MMAAVCLLSDGDGLVKTMAVISSAPVSQANSHPAQTDPLVFCWVTEWSQLSQPGPAPAQGARWEHTARRGKGKAELAAGTIKSPHPRLQAQQNAKRLGSEVGMMPLRERGILSLKLG